MGLLFLWSCKATKTTNKADTQSASVAMLPHLVVYKTRADYSAVVPVTLSQDKQEIISYPDPADLTNGSVPVRLQKGYYLDNRGVNQYTAFLNISYEDYIKLKSVPPAQSLYENILDKDPFVELYDCGIRTGYNSVDTLNQLIMRNMLHIKCRAVK